MQFGHGVYCREEGEGLKTRLEQGGAGVQTEKT